MPAPVLRIFMEGGALRRARAGEHAFANRLHRAFRGAGWTVLFCDPASPRARAGAAAGAPSLWHMLPPRGPLSLSLRLAYLHPFWRIETSHLRWEWEVARRRFDPAAVDPCAAAGFAARLRRREFGTSAARDEGFVYVPLQGRIAERRSFQTASPLHMLTATLAHTAPQPVLAGLHPRAVYTPADRRDLAALAAREPRLRLTDRPMAELLQGCGMVVTQNSAVALQG
ncbi:MAG: hypothetical protein ACU0AT_06740 [Tranquillimonas sp.]